MVRTRRKDVRRQNIKQDNEKSKGKGVEVVPRKDGTTIWYKQTLRSIKEEEEEEVILISGIPKKWR